MVGLDTTDVFECNNSFSDATIIQVCDTVSATIRSKEDQDFYLFSGALNDSFTLKVFNVPNEIDIQATLFDDLQIQIATDYSGQGQSKIFPFVLTKSGDFYLKLEDWSQNASSEEAYTMVLESNCATTGITPLSIVNFDSYPNPAPGAFTLRSSQVAIDSIALFDITGRRVPADINHDRHEAQVKSTYRGLVIVKVLTDQGVWVKKVLME